MPLGSDTPQRHTPRTLPPPLRTHRAREQTPRSGRRRSDRPYGEPPPAWERTPGRAGRSTSTLGLGGLPDCDATAANGCPRDRDRNRQPGRCVQHHRASITQTWTELSINITPAGRGPVEEALQGAAEPAGAPVTDVRFGEHESIVVQGNTIPIGMIMREIESARVLSWTDSREEAPPGATTLTLVPAGSHTLTNVPRPWAFVVAGPN